MLQQGHPAYVQDGFWILPRRLHTSLGPVIGQPQGGKSVLSCSEAAPVFQFVFTVFCLVLLSGSPQLFIQTDEMPVAFSSPGWTVPMLSASPHRRNAPGHRCCGPFLDSLIYSSLVLRSPGLLSCLKMKITSLVSGLCFPHPSTLLSLLSIFLLHSINCHFTFLGPIVATDFSVLLF